MGDSCVGKTSLLVCFNGNCILTLIRVESFAQTGFVLLIGDKFIVNQKTTVGVDYKARVVKLVGGEEVKLQVLFF